jgi:hypothetical protein
MALDRETQAASHPVDAPPKRKPFAWQPLTRRGVALFAQAPFVRLFMVQLLVALICTATVIWFLQQAWFPVVREAIDHLPADGTLQSGVLSWSGDPSQLLAEGPFLAFALDRHHRGGARSPAHVAVELGERDLKVFSLFGFYTVPYSKTWTTPFNRQDLLPWWGAWEPAILGIVALAVLVGLLLCWQVLATLYTIPVWLVAFFANRELSLSQSWRLAGAALMPGALFLTSLLLLYGLGVIDLIHLVVAAAIHLVIGWIYVFASPFSLPAVAPDAPGNPFTQGSAQGNPSAPTTTPP